MNKIKIIFLLSIFLASTIFFLQILKSGNNLGVQDWDQNFAWGEVTRKTIQEYRQFPFWNPFKCGGSVQFGNPEISVISFKTLFILIAGTVMGTKISIVFYSVFGFVGFYLLSKQYGLSKFGAIFASTIFSYSGITASYLSTGMVVFMNITHAPYVLYFLKKAEDRKANLILAAFFLALSYYFEYHIPLLLIIYLVIYYSFKSLVERKIKPLFHLLLLLVLFTIMAAPKLVLSLHLYSKSEVIYQPQSGYRIQDIPYFLLSKNQEITTSLEDRGYTFHIDEISLYTGIIPVTTFLFFFIKNKSGVKKYAPLLLSLLIIFWLMLGIKITPSLYSKLKTFPIFESFRVSQRFRFDFLIPFSLVAGLGFDRILSKLKNTKAKYFLSSIVILTVYLNLSTFATNNFLKYSLIIKNIGFEDDTGDFYQKKSLKKSVILEYLSNSLPNNFQGKSTFIPWSYEYIAVKNMVGIIECSDVITPDTNTKAINDVNYLGEWYTTSNLRKITLKKWSPNEIVLTLLNPNVEMSDDTLVLNQNYYPGWYVSIDGSPLILAENHNLLLATPLGGKESEIKFKYLPYKYIVDRSKIWLINYFNSSFLLNS